MNRIDRPCLRRMLITGAVSVVLTAAGAFTSPALAVGLVASLERAEESPNPREEGNPVDPGNSTGRPVLTVTCTGRSVLTSTVLFVPPGGADFFGTSGDDMIIGTDGADHIVAGGGHDTICGKDGADDINGEEGDDIIYGEGHTDHLQGGEGNDTIYGGPNPPAGDHELLHGGDGSDNLYGGAGPDTLDCVLFLRTPTFTDHGDGGTGMSNGAPENDRTVGDLTTGGPSNCDVTTNVP